MLRHSRIAAAFVVGTLPSSAAPSGAATPTRQQQPCATTRSSTASTHMKRRFAYHYSPYYAPAYPPAAPVAALPGAAVCFAFSLIGAC
jgi:hypothetical protein